MLENIKDKLRFLSRVISARRNGVGPAQKQLAEKTVEDSIAFLEDITAMRCYKKPEIIIEKKSFKHYRNLIGGFADEGGSFSPENPSYITLVEGENFTRTASHEVLHFITYHMDWNVVKSYARKNLSPDQILPLQVVIMFALEECSCYLFDALYLEKVTNKRIDVYNKANADQDDFANKLYYAFKYGLSENVLESYRVYLNVKYRGNSSTVNRTIYLRLTDAITQLIVNHHNGDLRASLIETIKMEKKGFQYTEQKLGTYVPENIPIKRPMDLMFHY